MSDEPQSKPPQSESPAGEDAPAPSPAPVLGTEEPAPAAAAIATPPAKKHYFWGVGRRKAAVARVRIRPGQGEFKINKRDIDKYFTEPRDRRLVVAPLTATGTKGKVDVFVNVGGGGYTGQAGAIVLGIARALKLANPDYESVLRDRGYLTRDSRIVERKKYGQRGARRRFQFSKR